MNRKQFFQRSLATLGLGLVFPSLILAKKSDREITRIYSGDQSLKHQKTLDVRKYPLHPDECWPPKESIPMWIDFTLTNVHDSIHMQIRAIDPAIGKDDRIFGGSGMIEDIEKTELHFALLTEKLRQYQTVILSYKYEDDDIPTNLYIPVRRLLKHCQFKWCAVRAGDKIDLSNERSGFVIERRNDRIDIYLSL